MITFKKILKITKILTTKQTTTFTSKKQNTTFWAKSKLTKFYLKWNLKYKINYLKKYKSIKTTTKKLNKKYLAKSLLTIKTQKIQKKNQKPFYIQIHQKNKNINLRKKQNTLIIKKNKIFIKNQLYTYLKQPIKLTIWTKQKLFLNNIKKQKKLQTFQTIPNYFFTINKWNNLKTYFWKTDLAKLYFQSLINTTNETLTKNNLINYDQLIQTYLPFFLTWKYNTFIKQNNYQSLFTNNQKIYLKKIEINLAKLLHIKRNKFLKNEYNKLVKLFKQNNIYKKITKFTKKKWINKLFILWQTTKIKQNQLKKYIQKFLKTTIIQTSKLITKWVIFQKKLKKIKTTKLNLTNFYKIEKYTQNLMLNKPTKLPFFSLHSTSLNIWKSNLKKHKLNNFLNLFNTQILNYNKIYNSKLNNLIIKSINKKLPAYSFLNYNLFNTIITKKSIIKNALYNIEKTEGKFLKKWDKLEKQNIRKSTQQKFRSSRFYRKFKKYTNILHLQRRRLNNLQFIKKWQRLKHTYSLFKYFKKYYFLKTFPGLKPWEIKKILKFYKKRTTKNLIFLNKKLNQSLIFKLLSLKFMGGLETIKILLKKKTIAVDSYIITNRYITLNSTNIISFNLPQPSLIFQYTKNNEIKWNFSQYFYKYDFLQSLLLNKNIHIQKTLNQYVLQKNQLIKLKPTFPQTNRLQKTLFIKNNIYSKTKYLKRFKLNILKQKINYLKQLSKIQFKTTIKKIRKFNFKPFDSKKLLKTYTKNKSTLNKNSNTLKNYWYFKYIQTLITKNKKTFPKTLLISKQNNNKISKFNFLQNTIKNPILITLNPHLYVINNFNTFEDSKNSILPLKLRKFKRRNKKYLRKFLTTSSITKSKWYKNTTYNLNKREWHDLTSLNVAITKY